MLIPISIPIPIGVNPLLTLSLRFIAWGLTVGSFWSLYGLLRDALQTTRRMHQIPCSRCRYFTQDYFLKCTVHPKKALSEDAIGCRDYDLN
jgi:hypothetical protein